MGTPDKHPSLGKKGCSGEQNGFYGKHHTLETRQKQLYTLHRSQSHIGRTHTTEQKQKISQSLKGKNVGRKHINKNGINKMVLPYELQQYLNDGWKLGRYNTK